MNKIKAVKGTYDILPGDIKIWQQIESVVRDVMAVYGYSEIRTPIFETTALFSRSIGEDTDIVGKEMYSFSDLGKRSLTLRPEGTASVVRAFNENSLDQRGLPQSLWYMGPMFRQERPQKGRQRQFHQFGVEVIGSPSHVVDAEVMVLFDMIANKLGLDNRLFSVNSIGGAESRENYRKVLLSFLDTIEDRLCDDCKRRKLSNPLRVLDCKVPGCREAVHHSDNLPKTVDYLTEDDKAHYKAVCGHLDDHGVKYVEDAFLVRGLDYYTGTVFEMNYDLIGAQSAIVGGGRYDNLVKELGGPDLPAVGFACGMERLVLVMKEMKKNEQADASTGGGSVGVYVVQSQRGMDSRAFKCVESLRSNGIPAIMDTLGRSMKAQMKSASRSGAEFAMILEADNDMVSARNMTESTQDSMLFDEFLNTMKNK